MINLNDYYYFAQVVENNGITAASRALNLPKSKLSRRISELEARLGARLIQRTSRSFLVTDLGHELYDHARKMLVEARAAESAVRSRVGEPGGKVRLSCSMIVSQLGIAEAMAPFLRRFPKIHVVQEVIGPRSDSFQLAADLILVSHEVALSDSSFIKRQLLVEPLYLFASPDYLSTSEALLHPHDLRQHSILAQSSPSNTPHWELAHNATLERVDISLEPRLVSDDLYTLKSAAVEGAGIVALPAAHCRREVEQKRLVRVLPHWNAGTSTISALMPSNRGTLPAVRALLDYFAEELPALVTGVRRSACLNA